jgi:hypothetical protein
MPEVVNIPLADLLLDSGNPRLVETKETQQETATALARQQGDNLLRLATDIVEHGLDPTALPAVVATADRQKRYKVVEGNRRILALRALETPSLVTGVLSPSSARRLVQLAARYEENPMGNVPCVLFDTEEEAQHWVLLRHTGQNQGVGLVEWGTEEQDRYNARHAGTRRPAGQVIAFVDKHGTLSAEARASHRKIITTLQRMLNTAYVRQALGIDVQDRQVIALYPTSELARSLSRLVEDLKLNLQVPDLYHLPQREDWVDSLPASVKPRKSKMLKTPVFLDNLTAGEPSQGATRTPRRRKVQPTRTTVIPRSSTLEVTPPRINAIYNELSNLNVEQYPNASSVLLRVFIELSVDHYIADKKLLTEKQVRESPLAKRLKTVVKYLETSGAIQARLARAVEAMADNQRSAVGASVVTMHGYVHNEFAYPKSHDLYATWDEIAPVMEQMWP